MGIGKWLHNVSGSTVNYGHGDILDNGFWEIPTSAILERLSGLSSLFQDVSSGDIELSRDGVSSIDGDPVAHWNFLRSHVVDFDKKTSSLGIPMVSVYDPEGEFQTFISHDFTDKTSWYSQSSRVLDESPSVNSEDPKIYELSHDNVIDLTHGKVTREDAFAGDYSVIVKKGGIVQTSGYSIDYENGRIIFESDPAPSQILVSYSYAVGSGFVLKPETGKKLVIRRSEIQFTSDVRMTVTKMEIWGYNPADLPNKIPYEVLKYKNVKDMLNIANLCYMVPAFHDITADLYVFPFDYARPIILDDASGMELRISTENDAPFEKSPGAETTSFATVSIYAAVL